MVGGRVGQNRVPTYGVCAVFLAGKSPDVRPYSVHLHGSG